MQATQVVARLREVLQVELPVRAIYDAPTILALASSIEKIKRQTKGQALLPIQRADRKSWLPLSFAQLRLWFLDQLQADSPLYNIPGAFSIKGALNVIALEQSLHDLVQRHEPLRTTFAVHDEQPVQIIAPALDLPLFVVDLSDLADSLRQETVAHLASEEAQRPFQLQLGPLVRAILLRLNPRAHILLLTLHHIVADGWSAEIFFSELDACYIARVTGGTAVPVQLPDLPIQYADYAFWQRQWLQGEVLEQQLTYWRTQLAGIPPALELPTDHPRPPVQTFHGRRHPFSCPPALSVQLKALIQQEGVTLFMILLAALQTLLFRYSGQTDIVIGSPIAGRTRLEVERMIGFFVNTLVLRTNLSGNPRWKDVLFQVREMTLAAYSYQDLPFEKLVEELQLERRLSQSPLFQVLFVLQNISARRVDASQSDRGLNLEQLEIESGTAKFDLSFELVETPVGIEGYIEYNTDLFEPATIERMAGHYTTLLAGMVTDLEQPIATLPLLTPAERRQMLEEWNTPYRSPSQHECLHTLFEIQAAQTPDKIAIVFEEQQITYRELDQRANQLAWYLQRLGVGPESLVGLCCERSLEMVIGMMGILKAGAAYVPLDPDYPSQRLAFLIMDTNMSVLLTQQRLVERLPEIAPSQRTDHALRVLCLDTEWWQIAPLPLDDPDGLNIVESSRTVEMELTTEETSLLLHEVLKQQDVQMDAVLIMAIAWAFGEWTRQRALLVRLFSHGREPLFEDMDISRTVGALATDFPVYIDLASVQNEVDALQLVKEHLKKIPHHGIGYGILRVLGQSSEAEALRATPEPEVVVNYIGEGFSEAPKSEVVVHGPITGHYLDTQSDRTYIFQITGRILDGKFHTQWDYSEQLHRRSTVEFIAKAVLRAIQSLIARSISSGDS